MPPDGEAWSFDRKTTDLLVKSRALTREKGQTFLGYDIFFWGDDTVFGEIKDSKLPPGLGITKLYDFPLGIAAKIRRWQALGADGFFDQWGTQAEYVPCNAVALRELVARQAGVMRRASRSPSSAPKRSRSSRGT